MSESVVFEQHKNIPYSSDPSPYKTVDIWSSKTPSQQASSGLWILFIHGGIWRAPDITAWNFAALAVAVLERHPHIGQIAGCASLNYRLSPFPNHPTNPSKSDDPDRNVKHPAHLQDVLEGIKYLQGRFSFGERYILVGHSCGATLAFQVLQHLLQTPTAPPTPTGIIGIAGLYDLILLRDTDAYPPMYQNFISNAFGADEAIWRAASPVSETLDFDAWNGKLISLVLCDADEYVPVDQFIVMETKLRQSGWSQRSDVAIKIGSVSGKHDDCWMQGFGLANSVEDVLEELRPQQ